MAATAAQKSHAMYTVLIARVLGSLTELQRENDRSDNEQNQQLRNDIVKACETQHVVEEFLQKEGLRVSKATKNTEYFTKLEKTCRRKGKLDEFYSKMTAKVNHIEHKEGDRKRERFGTVFIKGKDLIHTFLINELVKNFQENTLQSKFFTTCDVFLREQHPLVVERTRAVRREWAAVDAHIKKNILTTYMPWSRKYEKFNSFVDDFCSDDSDTKCAANKALLRSVLEQEHIYDCLKSKKEEEGWGSWLHALPGRAMRAMAGAMLDLRTAKFVRVVSCLVTKIMATYLAVKSLMDMDTTVLFENIAAFVYDFRGQKVDDALLGKFYIGGDATFAACKAHAQKVIREIQLGEFLNAVWRHWATTLIVSSIPSILIKLATGVSAWTLSTIMLAAGIIKRIFRILADQGTFGDKVVVGAAATAITAVGGIYSYCFQNIGKIISSITKAGTSMVPKWFKDNWKTMLPVLVAGALIVCGSGWIGFIGCMPYALQLGLNLTSYAFIGSTLTPIVPFSGGLSFLLTQMIFVPVFTHYLYKLLGNFIGPKVARVIEVGELASIWLAVIDDVASLAMIFNGRLGDGGRASNLLVQKLTNQKGYRPETMSGCTSSIIMDFFQFGTNNLQFHGEKTVGTVPFVFAHGFGEAEESRVAKEVMQFALDTTHDNIVSPEEIANFKLLVDDTKFDVDAYLRKTPTDSWTPGQQKMHDLHVYSTAGIPESMMYSPYKAGKAAVVEGLAAAGGALVEGAAAVGGAAVGFATFVLSPLAALVS